MVVGWRRNPEGRSGESLGRDARELFYAAALLHKECPPKAKYWSGWVTFLRRKSSR